VITSDAREMGSSESKITHPSRIPDTREQNKDITPVECVDKASLEEKQHPKNTDSDQSHNESKSSKNGQNQQNAGLTRECTADTQLKNSPESPDLSTGPKASAASTQQNLTSKYKEPPKTNAKDVTVDELTAMTRELDKTLTPDPGMVSENGSESLSMLSQNEIEALILKQYRSSSDRQLGIDLTSTQSINERSNTETEFDAEEEFVTPRQVVDRDPAEWAVHQENRTIEGFDMEKFKAANQKQFGVPVSSH